VPAVDRIAPKLAGGAEVIRWDPGHYHRLQGFIQLENVRVGPHIRTLVIHIDREIAYDLNLPLVAVGLESRPLPEEEILNPFPCLDTLGEQFLPLLAIGRGPVFDPCRPGAPWQAAALLLKSIEQGVVVQPPGLLTAECHKVRVSAPVAALVPGSLQQGCFAALGRLVIHSPGGEGGNMVEVGGCEEAVLYQEVRADEERIAGGSRSRGIGRISAQGGSGSEWQDLPQALSGLRQEIHKAVGTLSQIPHAIA